MCYDGGSILGCDAVSPLTVALSFSGFVSLEAAMTYANLLRANASLRAFSTAVTEALAEALAIAPVLPRDSFYALQSGVAVLDGSSVAVNVAYPTRSTPSPSPRAFSADDIKVRMEALTLCCLETRQLPITLVALQAAFFGVNLTAQVSCGALLQAILHSKQSELCFPLTQFM